MNRSGVPSGVRFGTRSLTEVGVGWIALAALAFTLVAGGMADAQQAQVRLRAAPVAEGSQITLGDLFENAGAAAGVVVGRAPGPGQRVVFSAPVLQNRAARAGLAWPNAEGLREVVVQGAARSAAAAPGPGPGPGTGPSAGLGPSAQPAAQQPAEHGREVAVLTRPIARGEAISIDDVAFMPATRATPADAITELDALVGMSARRSLAADRPLRPGDVMVTPLVKRGEPVTLLFQAGSVRITLRGRALEDGGAGETIRVLNSDSERTVEAIVEGPGLARVLVPATSATVAATPASTAGRARTGGL